MKTRLFKISLKLYYHELSDWSSEYVRAMNRRAALRKFANRHRIKEPDTTRPENWRWWEDGWFKAFHAIEQVSGRVRTCPRCDGAGTVTTA